MHEEAINSAIGSARLEGIQPTPFVRDLFDRVRSEELTLAEAVEMVVDHYQPAGA